MNVCLTLNLLCAVAAADALAAPERARAATDARLRAELETLSGRSVYFGHMSVGANVVEGLRDLAAAAGVPLRIVETPSAATLPPGAFGHGLVGGNGEPAGKLVRFGAALGPRDADVQLALVKLCYVDVLADTDTRALFARYQAELRDLQAKHPRTRFVHVTVPLTVVQSGWKSVVKSLLGRPRWGFLENARREELNALLRGAYEGREPIFDLARAEATRPDGRLETEEVEGRRVPVLVAAYTDDGGHLNAVGRRHVARELVRVLAAVPVRAGAAESAKAR